MRTIQVYSRQGCHLCEVLLESLLPMVRGTFEVEVLDIDTRPDWRSQYDTRIPVVEYDGRTICQYHLDREAVVRLLEQVGDSGTE